MGEARRWGASREKLGLCGQGPEVIGAGLFHFLGIRVLPLSALAGTGRRGLVSGSGCRSSKEKKKKA